ncbi:putative ABC-like lipid transport protein [Ordospora colligata]|nr:putative ABC-like lipid transport protein [Ordospora colligata]
MIQTSVVTNVKNQNIDGLEDEELDGHIEGSDRMDDTVAIEMERIDETYEIKNSYARDRKKPAHLLDGHMFVKRGEVNAILGPSGSGKTTMMTMAGCMCDYSISTYGEVRFNGKKKHKLDHALDIAYMPQHDDLELLSELTGREFIQFTVAKSMTDEKRNGMTDEEIVEDIINTFNMREFTNRPLRKLSGGQRQRIRIAEVLVRRAAYTFFDEPTTGLDANTAPNIIKAIKNYAEKHNIGVVISIHQPSDSMCKEFHNIFIMAEGVTVYGGLYGNSLFECLDKEAMELQEQEAIERGERNDNPVRIAYTDEICKSGISMPDFIASITSKEVSHYKNEDLQRQKEVIGRLIKAKRKRAIERAEEYNTVIGVKDYDCDMKPSISQVWNNIVTGIKVYLSKAGVIQRMFLTSLFVLGTIIITYAMFKQKVKYVNGIEMIMTKTTPEQKFTDTFMGIHTVSTEGIIMGIEPKGLRMLIGFTKATNMMVLFALMSIGVYLYIKQMLRYISRDGKIRRSSPVNTYLSMLLFHACTMGLFITIVIFSMVVICTKKTSIEFSVLEYLKFFGWIYGWVMLTFHQLLFLCTTLNLEGGSPGAMATIGKIVFFCIAFIAFFEGIVGPILSGLLKKFMDIAQIFPEETAGNILKLTFKSWLGRIATGDDNIVDVSGETMSIPNLIPPLRCTFFTGFGFLPSWLLQILRWVWMFLTPINTFLNYAKYSLLPAEIQDVVVKNSGTIYGTIHPNIRSLGYAFFSAFGFAVFMIGFLCVSTCFIIRNLLNDCTHNQRIEIAGNDGKKQVIEEKRKGGEEQQNQGEKDDENENEIDENQEEQENEIKESTKSWFSRSGPLFASVSFILVLFVVVSMVIILCMNKISNGNDSNVKKYIHDETKKIIINNLKDIAVITSKVNPDLITKIINNHISENKEATEEQNAAITNINSTNQEQIKEVKNFEKSILQIMNAKIDSREQNENLKDTNDYRWKSIEARDYFKANIKVLKENNGMQWQKTESNNGIDDPTFETFLYNADLQIEPFIDEYKHKLGKKLNHNLLNELKERKKEYKVVDEIISEIRQDCSLMKGMDELTFKAIEKNMSRCKDEMKENRIMKIDLEKEIKRILSIDDLYLHHKDKIFICLMMFKGTRDMEEIFDIIRSQDGYTEDMINHAKKMFKKQRMIDIAVEKIGCQLKVHNNSCEGIAKEISNEIIEREVEEQIKEERRKAGEITLNKIKLDIIKHTIINRIKKQSKSNNNSINEKIFNDIHNNDIINFKSNEEIELNQDKYNSLNGFNNEKEKNLLLGIIQTEINMHNNVNSVKSKKAEQEKNIKSVLEEIKENVKNIEAGLSRFIRGGLLTTSIINQFNKRCNLIKNPPIEAILMILDEEIRKEKNENLKNEFNNNGINFKNVEEYIKEEEMIGNEKIFEIIREKINEEKPYDKKIQSAVKQILENNDGDEYDKITEVIKSNLQEGRVFYKNIIDGDSLVAINQDVYSNIFLNALINAENELFEQIPYFVVQSMILSKTGKKEASTSQINDYIDENSSNYNEYYADAFEQIGGTFGLKGVFKAGGYDFSHSKYFANRNNFGESYTKLVDELYKFISNEHLSNEHIRSSGIDKCLRSIVKFSQIINPQKQREMQQKTGGTRKLYEAMDPRHKELFDLMLSKNFFDKNVINIIDYINKYESGGKLAKASSFMKSMSNAYQTLDTLLKAAGKNQNIDKLFNSKELNDVIGMCVEYISNKQNERVNTWYLRVYYEFMVKGFKTELDKMTEKINEEINEKKMPMSVIANKTPGSKSGQKNILNYLA